MPGTRLLVFRRIEAATAHLLRYVTEEAPFAVRRRLGRGRGVDNPSTSCRLWSLGLRRYVGGGILKTAPFIVVAAPHTRESKDAWQARQFRDCCGRRPNTSFERTGMCGAVAVAHLTDRP